MSAFRPVFLILFALIGCAAVQKPLPQFSLAGVDENDAISARVNVPRHGHGSGVVISTVGYVLTSEHVVSHVSTVMVILPDADGTERHLPAKVVAKDQKRDLALLKLDRSLPTAAKLSGVRETSTATFVYGIGYPGRQIRVVSRGVIQTIPSKGDIVAEMPAEGGSAGCGVYSAATGNLVGIHKSTLSTEDGERSVIVSADEIRAFLKENRISLEP